MPSMQVEAFHSLPEQVKSAVWAMSILMNRVELLPSADREDFFELVQEWRKASCIEERRSIHRAIDEILEQSPVRVEPLQTGIHAPHDFRGPAAKAIGKRVRELREVASFSQSELAEKAELYQSHISRIERGEHYPNNKTLEKIATAFGVPINQVDPDR